MKVFAIRKKGRHQRNLAYLYHFEREDRFYIEIPEETDPQDLPALLASFAESGQYTVDSHWSRLWLRHCGWTKGTNLASQDTFEMQNPDSATEGDAYLCYPLREKDLPPEISSRFRRKIMDVVPLSDFQLLVFFRDGVTRKCPLEPFFRESREFFELLQQPELFWQARILPGGYGIVWKEDLTIPDSALYEMGDVIPLSLQDFYTFVKERTIDAPEAAALLCCSRQNVVELTKHGKLHPVKASGRHTLYLKSEVLSRTW